MRPNKITLRLALLIAPLAILAAGAGLFWQSPGTAYAFHTLRGETVTIQGHGLYRYDSVNSAAQELGQDWVTLIIGVPLLLTGILMARQGSLRGQLLLNGALGYFLYTYAAMCFLTAFNTFFLVYVALFSLSLFGFVLALRAIDVEELRGHIAPNFPRPAIATYFIIVAAFLGLAWVGLVLPPMLRGTPPAGLETAITMVIQVLDLGVIVPTTLLCSILLIRNHAWGFALSTIILLKMMTMGAALIAMIISQMLAGISVDPVVSVIFVLISLSGILLGVRVLMTIQERPLTA